MPRSIKYISIGISVLILFATFGLLSSSCSKDSTDVNEEEKPSKENDIEIKMGPFVSEASSDSFFRYEIVEIIARFDLAKIPSGDDANVTGVIKFDDKTVADVAGRESLKFVKTDDVGVYVGRWAAPWNPEVGEYSCKVSADMTGKKVSDECVFTIKGRPTVKAKPLCIMTLESDTRFKNRPVRNPDKSKSGWEQLVSWSEYMGADAFFYLGGITKQAYGPTMENPWYDYNHDFTYDLAAETQKRGMSFGVWLGAYLPYGQTQVGLPYDFSRNLVEGQFFYTLHISLSDKKRKAHIIDLIKEFDSADDIDYVGIDYIRTGFGGYELVDEFVDELNIEVPDDFDARSLEGRMWWLVAKLRSRDSEMIDLWQWWRASKAARTLKSIKDGADVKKPFFCFMLSYEFGHQHGQDPLMMYDAGADVVLQMFYDADRNNFDYLIKSWPEYAREGQAHIVPGLSVDYRFLENEWNPQVNQPMEMFNRFNDIITNIYADGNVEGLFFHDIDRMLYTRRGEEFIGNDYAIAGGAAFTRLREREKTIPLQLRIEKVRAGGSYPKIDCSLKNISTKTVEDIDVSLEYTHGVFPNKFSRKHIKEIKPGETKEFTIDAHTGAIDRRHIIGVLAVWGDNPGTQERAFDIACPLLYKLPEKKEPEEEEPKEVGSEEEPGEEIPETP